ncbi:hypothetical protein GCM10011515_13210 [Tsuneonella deserti]|uniref:Antifreeze glycopeptide polyprotein n=1 Tax=Tsuneonella deserti TaxID=2035528 RepID=A0ABQ1S7K8_9SPHN|nr:hypothetical protein [Tsuneonella deserti]GGD94783.1 hypothetical protein GCM10011515_13210 [Tsuneonella deserti]
MRRLVALVGGAATLALASGLAVAQSAPESLLPPGFDEPKPGPTATATGAPAPGPRSSGQPGAPVGEATSIPVIQPIPGAGSKREAPGAAPELPAFAGKLPSLDEIEKMSTDELDELLGLKPKVDIPPGARRSLEQVGVLAPSEGGLPTFSLANQPASLVRAALTGAKGPVVSRWGHVLLRRALASRLASPDGMDPADFAALRIAALNAMGEFTAARAIAQDVDTAEWNPALTNAALDAYIGTADLVGACPAVRLQGSGREDANWRLLQGICNAFSGEAARAKADLNRVRSRGQAASIDALLAQRYAGAAGQGRGAVTIEWDGVDELTPMRFALANAVGEPVPDGLLESATPYYSRVSAVAPMLALPQRIAASDLAAREGILSSAALIDLYSMAYAEEDLEGPAATLAGRLRQAYVGADAAARMDAIRDVWGERDAGKIGYARLILTAYAAARLEPNEDFADDAGPLLAAMLSAGLERDALRWADVVPQGSAGWAQLVFAAPSRNAVSSGAVDDFVSDDDSAGKRRSQFLIAGLAGLGRIDGGDAKSYSADLKMRLNSATPWTRAIDGAAAVDNQALVALLAGLGMQGEGWDRMTARHLYHIVSALNRVGLSAEARMIAAEAVARA